MPSSTPTCDSLSDITQSQRAVQSWGVANQVSLDIVKEAMNVISSSNLVGDTFNLFDTFMYTQLRIADAGTRICNNTSLKMRSILGARRFCSV